ncbi:ComEC family protein [Erwinia sp. S38]|uniref:ComEC family protein n=1 Tax=Erwinia sp. S38 TaxID=2769338 RepID=UPI00190A63D1|nr:ComEC family protein [Erwinia sp. S38]MBK0001854.1 ComEC family protein [Erwinia sp. S38]
MRITATQLAGSLIIGTLPLTVIPRLPGYGYDIAAIVLSFFLMRCSQRVAIFTAMVLLFSLWPLNTARSLQDQIDRLTQGIVRAEVQIDTVLPGAERARVRLFRQDGRLLFPPIYASLRLPGGEQTFCQGQRWDMALALRPLHAQLNEGGFDRQRFTLANSMPLTGRVISAEVRQPRCSWRAAIMNSTRQNYGHLSWQALISALAFGDRSEVKREITQLLRETGTAHLMAIAGMQIGLAAGFGWLVARLIQFFFPAWMINYRFPLYSSLLVALIYCWLSGSNPPAMRAMLALLMWSALRLKGINCSSWQVWLFCIALILFLEPLSILSDSLWMSALAVAGLLIWYQSFALPIRFRRRKRWLPLRLLHLQLGMLLLLMPLQVFIFHGFSLSALVANLWAVPLISLVTVPLILTSLLLNFLPLVGPFIWWLADRSLALVFFPLQQLPNGWFPLESTFAAGSLACWLLLLAFRFGWWRSSPFTLVAYMLLLLSWRNFSAKPEWRVDMLDVGHGLAVVISQDGKAVLYDTGNRWPGGDVAHSQIIPWLEWQGLTLTDVVISHAHLDHIGGLPSIQSAYPDARVRSALKRPGHLPCYRDVGWRWQGLTFQALWPPENMPGEGNNQSCVVMVSDGRWRVLLTGDIEREAEQQLVAEQRAALSADLLQVPHHGSRTSSTPPLLRAVAPKAAIASAARYSAWRLPAAKIMMRYDKNRIIWRDTALSGQISARFFVDNWHLLGLREQIMNRWYHQWFGVPRESR